jgi:hypothetical protein
MMRLDGNAAGGMLREVFAREMTTALATCIGCERVSPIGTLLDYGGEMGAILRCPSCDTVMLRIVRTPTGFHVDASGSALIFIGL